jgi:tetratricopeptide (TPR) repeat protein
MSRRFFHLFASAAVVLAVTGAPALAQAPDQQPPEQNAPDQQTPDHPPSAEPKLVEPPANLPRPQHGDRKINLDKLFEALKVAPSQESAKYVENRIWALWLAAGGDTATLLMGRVKTAMDKKDYDLAIKLLNAIIDFQPNYVEAWNRRATIYFAKKDYASALADIHEVLAREPRHFGALAGLGTILQEFGDDRHALEAFRRALAVHPKLEKVPDMVKRLTEKVEGRDI